MNAKKEKQYQQAITDLNDALRRNRDVLKQREDQADRLKSFQDVVGEQERALVVAQRRTQNYQRAFQLLMPVVDAKAREFVSLLVRACEIFEVVQAEEANAECDAALEAERQQHIRSSQPAPDLVSRHEAVLYDFKAAEHHGDVIADQAQRSAVADAKLEQRFGLGGSITKSERRKAGKTKIMRPNRRIAADTKPHKDIRL